MEERPKYKSHTIDFGKLPYGPGEPIRLQGEFEPNDDGQAILKRAAETGETVYINFGGHDGPGEPFKIRMLKDKKFPFELYIPPWVGELRRCAQHGKFKVTIDRLECPECDSPGTGIDG